MTCHVLLKRDANRIVFFKLIYVRLIGIIRAFVGILADVLLMKIVEIPKQYLFRSNK